MVGAYEKTKYARYGCRFRSANNPRLTNNNMTLRRVKTYTGGQGYVYEYYFVGKRKALPGARESAATEYIFDVSADRKTSFAVSVLLLDHAVKSWSASRGRELSDTEQYGAVKMRLFAAFDEIENMLADGRRLEIDTGALSQLLGKLGVE